VSLQFDPCNPCSLTSSSVAVRSMPRLCTKHKAKSTPLTTATSLLATTEWSSAVPPCQLFDVATPLQIFSRFLIIYSSHNLSFYTPLRLVTWTSLFSNLAGLATWYSNWETAWTTGQIDSTGRCLSQSKMSGPGLGHVASYLEGTGATWSSRSAGVKKRAATPPIVQTLSQRAP